MKKFLLFTMLFGSASFSAFAQTNVNQPARNKAEQEVIAVNQQYVDALVKKDGAAFERILADEFAETDTAIGVGNDKQMFLAPYKNGAIFSAPGLESIDVSDPKVSIHKDTAVLTSRQTLKGKTKDGQAYRVPILLTSVFTKRHGRWQIVATHASRIDQLQAQTSNVSSK